MLKDYRWDEHGLSVIGGTLLDLYQSLDQIFVKWAMTEYSAKEYLFPTLINAKELGKIDYLQSFPHLATFPICLAQTNDNLKRFVEGQPLSLAGEVNLTDTNPIQEILTPAACYHLYIYLQEINFQSTAYMTTVNNCFRRETEYSSLQRQWNFHMREVVCFGTQEDVEQFLENARSRLSQFCVALGLSVDWTVATDPFFQPDRDPKYVAQLISPVKLELLLNHLAIASINYHRDYFGKRFNILINGEIAHSACVAFGLERWIYAFLDQFGPTETDWPHLPSFTL